MYVWVCGACGGQCSGEFDAKTTGSPVKYISKFSTAFKLVTTSLHIEHVDKTHTLPITHL